VCTEKNRDEHSLLQTAITQRDEDGRFVDYRQQGQGAEKMLLAAQAAQLRESGEVEQSLRTLAQTTEEVQAARASTKAAVDFESHAAESLKLASEEGQQVEDIQEARAHQEAHVSDILHEAVQQLRRSPSEGANVALLQSLQKAEVAQAAMIKDATQEDQALLGLRKAVANAAQAAVTAKLVDETQTSPTLAGAVQKLQAVEDTQLHQVHQSVQHTKSVSNQVQLLRESALASEAHVKQLETELAKAASEQKESNWWQKVRADASAEHRKAEVARQQASAMYQAASSTQAALEAQAAKTAESLMRVSTEATQAAHVLQDALGGSRTPPVY